MSTQRLVLMPGMHGTGELFEPVLREIPQASAPRVISYPGQALGFADLVAIAERGLPDGRCVLVAESFSGPVAIQLARRLPERVSALILVATFVANPLPCPASLVGLVLRAPLTQWAIRTFMLDHDTPEPLIAKARACLRSVDRRVLLSRLHLLETIDVTEDFRQLKMPILHLRPEQDRLLPARCAAAFGSTTQAMPGPHFLLQRHPAECWKRMSLFLSSRLL